MMTHSDFLYLCQRTFPHSRISIGYYLRHGYACYNTPYYLISVDNVQFCSDTLSQETIEKIKTDLEWFQKRNTTSLDTEQANIQKVLRKKNPTLKDILSLIVSK